MALNCNHFLLELHKVELTSGLVNGTVVMAVRKNLPVEGVDILLGNNLAGGKVWPESPPPPVVNVTLSPPLESDECAQGFPSGFTSCALTRAMAKMEAELLERSLSLLYQSFLHLYIVIM